MNRPVALKMLCGGDLADAKGMVRFLAEAEAVAAVKHPHVVQVYDFGQHAGRPFLAFELLTGGSLADRLRGGPLVPNEVAKLVAKLADAVQAAHDLGIVHRDLKPSNILFQVTRDERRVASEEKNSGSGRSLATCHSPLATQEPKITNFGLAKRTGGAELTRTQAVMGTPAYMAPGQARGEAKFVGPTADI